MAVERIREVRGTALPLRGDDIDTDRIIPARFLKSITFEGLQDHLFEDDRQQLDTHPVSNAAYAGAAVFFVMYAKRRVTAMLGVGSMLLAIALIWSM